MKKILVPTDFSSAADNAFKFAIDLAAKFKSELVLYHAYSFNRKFDYDDNHPEHLQPYLKNLETQVENTRLKFQAITESLGLSVKIILEENDVFYLFKEKAAKHKVNLIVMGTTGATGIERVIYGSTAVMALEVSTVPVLFVPPGYTLKGLDRIVLATDMKDVSPKTLEPLKNLALNFEGKVTVLNVKNDSESDKPWKDQLPMDKVKSEYVRVPLLKSINDSINAFVERDESDLVCMIRRKKGFFESLFKKSVKKTRVHHGKLPFLVLPE